METDSLTGTGTDVELSTQSMKNGNQTSSRRKNGSPLIVQCEWVLLPRKHAAAVTKRNKNMQSNDPQLYSNLLNREALSPPEKVSAHLVRVKAIYRFSRKMHGC